MMKQKSGRSKCACQRSYRRNS